MDPVFTRSEYQWKLIKVGYILENVDFNFNILI